MNLTLFTIESKGVMMMPYCLTIDPRVLEQYSGYSALIIYARELENGPSDEESTAVLRGVEQQCRARLTPDTFPIHPHIVAWREAYRSFGAKPKKYPCSLEALLARTLKGQDIPAINRIVDLYNAISIKHMLPVGGEDWDTLVGDLYLTYAAGSEVFSHMQAGQETIAYPEPGEIIWADQAGVTCRRWNWRQGIRTQLTVDTRAAYFVLDRLAPYTKDALMVAGEELMYLLKQISPKCAITFTLLSNDETQ